MHLPHHCVLGGNVVYASSSPLCPRWKCCVCVFLTTVSSVETCMRLPHHCVLGGNVYASSSPLCPRWKHRVCIFLTTVSSVKRYVWVFLTTVSSVETLCMRLSHHCVLGGNVVYASSSPLCPQWKRCVCVFLTTVSSVESIGVLGLMYTCIYIYYIVCKQQ